MAERPEQFRTAVNNGRQDVVEMMVTNGFNINHLYQPRAADGTSWGQTALMIAVKIHRHRMVKLLLSLGANMEIPSENGETALVYAVNELRPAIIAPLVRAGANVNQLDSTQENLLLRAVRAYKDTVLRALLCLETTGRRVAGSQCVSAAFIDSAFREALVLAVSARDQVVDWVAQRLNELNSAYIIRNLLPLVSENTVSDRQLFANCLTFDSEVLYQGFDLSRLMLQHGFAFNSNMLLSPLLYVKLGETSIARILILTCDDRQSLKEHLTVVLRMDHPIEQLQERRISAVRASAIRAATSVVDKLSRALSLEDLCIITVRSCLRGRMWSKIDVLPLPALVKDKLKLM